jgi:FtsP/CotA-like multicopper oxidase with cupredoxin domain
MLGMISRRSLLKLSGLAAASASLPAVAQELAAPDYKLEIAPVSWELGPRHTVKTLAYNGQIPGPLLRFKEGQPVTIDVTNRGDREDVVHWHGLHIPPAVDGAMEEGTPMIAAGASTRVTFTPSPAGFRWYHTHTTAGGDLTLGQYGGRHGLLMIEPRDNPGRYDQEFFLNLHDWGGHLLANGDGSMNPSYDVTTINGKMMGAGEPLRVKQGQRVLLHVLNSSATEPHWVSLSGHTLRVVALDGNPVPQPQDVPMLRLGPAERATCLVEMNNPGVWVVEYADKSGEAQWQQPSDLTWNYQQFGSAEAASDDGGAPAIVIPMVFASKFRGHGAMEEWTINGKSYPDNGPVPLKQGQRYRLRFINKSADDHPVHLHRHTFELKTLDAAIPAYKETLGKGDGIRTAGVMKDVVIVDAQTQAEVEFTANHPGSTLFHCHQQDHMDMGFMMLFNYV